MLFPCLKDLINPCLVAALKVVESLSVLLQWEFEDGVGFAITSENGPNGTLDADQWVTGIVGTYAIDLNLNQAFSDSAISFNSKIVTASFWVNANNINAGDLVICDSESGNYFVIEFDTNDIAASIFNASGQYQEKADFTGLDGDWVHVSVVFDNRTAGGDIKIRLNAILQADNPTVQTKTTFDNFDDDLIRIGSTPINNADVLFDGLYIHPYELSEADVIYLIKKCPIVRTTEDGNLRYTENGQLRFTA